MTANQHLLRYRSRRIGVFRNDRISPFAELQRGTYTQAMKLPFPLSQLLPRKRATETDARRAMLACGIGPDELAWSVSADGTFAFGRKHPDAEGPTYDQIDCLTEWARRERIKLGLIAWETGPS
jgi:hypothetical protein